MEIEGVGEHKKAFIISIGSMRLQMVLVLVEELPVFAVVKARLYEDAVLVSGEVGSTHDLTHEEDLRGVISLDSLGSALMLIVFNLLVENVSAQVSDIVLCVLESAPRIVIVQEASHVV